MRYTIEEIRQMPEGQTFDCKSIHIEPIAVGISDKTRRIEGVDRMCRELSVIGTKEPQYHPVAFIMKASVWANVLEEGQEKGKRPSQVARKQTRKEAELPRNSPETRH